MTTRQLVSELTSRGYSVKYRIRRDGGVLITSIDSQKFKGGKGKALYVHYEKWQIAHLLEFGWTKRNGERLERTPYIRPLFDRNKEKYFNMYKEALNG